MHILSTYLKLDLIYFEISKITFLELVFNNKSNKNLIENLVTYTF